MIASIFLGLVCAFIFVSLVFLFVKLMYYIIIRKDALINEPLEAEEKSKESSYWNEADTENEGMVPSHARHVYSTAVPVYIRMNQFIVLRRNGEKSSYFFLDPKHQKTSATEDEKDANMFILHFFDLKNFKPPQEEISVDHLERTECYAIIESVLSGQMYYNMNDDTMDHEEKPLFSFNHKDPMSEIFSSDNRFFKIRKVTEEASEYCGKYQFQHMSSEMILTSKTGTSTPMTYLQLGDGPPQEHDTFTIEPVLLDGNIKYTASSVVVRS